MGIKNGQPRIHSVILERRKETVVFFLILEMVPISSKISHSVHAIILYHVTSMLIKFRRIIITFLPLFAVLSFSFLDTVDTKFIFLRSLFGYWPSSYTLLLIEIVFLYISSNLVDSSPRMRPRGIIPLG